MENQNDSTGKKRKYLPAGETALFCTQISLVLRAGIPLHDGIETLYESAEGLSAQKVFKDISILVGKSGSLYDALKKVDIFPPYMVNMIHIGEEVGKLDDVLVSLSEYYEREDKIRKSIRSAIFYPLILIIMMAVVVTVLITKVIPVFEQIYQNLGTEMSAAGKAIMNLGSNSGKVVLILVIVILLILIFMMIFSRTNQGADKLRNFIGKLPFLKSLNQKIASGRFVSVLSMMISSGYELEKSLEMAPDIVEDKITKEKIVECGNLLREGVSFPDALAMIDIFSPLYNRMIYVGFKAGQLDSVMERLTRLYEEEVDDTITKLVSFIEPTLVAILSIIIGGILISVMLPLTSIMSSIG
ncbi:MAG: type II secretion system F family protein [Clostridiales bacterium]|nr:type II secretion system F family protein [Clostridiales bacterium]